MVAATPPVSTTTHTRFTKMVTKSHITVTNLPARIEISQEHGRADDTHESRTRLKRGWLVGSKDINPIKRNEAEKSNTTKLIVNVLEKTSHEANDDVEHNTWRKSWNFLSNISIMERYRNEMKLIMKFSHSLCQKW